MPADKSPAFGGEVLWASESNCLAFTAAPAGRVYTVLLLSGGISGSCFLLCREGSFLDTRQRRGKSRVVKESGREGLYAQEKPDSLIG